VQQVVNSRVNSVVSKKVLRISLETSFDAILVIDTGPDHLQEGVLGKAGVVGVIESLGEGPGQVDLLVELATRQEPSVAGELARRRFRSDGHFKEIQIFLPGRWYTHICSVVVS
jgi:hypothetical protein